MTPVADPPPQNVALARGTDGRIGLIRITRADIAAVVLTAPLAPLFIAEFATGGPDRWGLSAQALRQGRYETLLTHMLAHVSPTHLVMNAGAMISLSAVLLRSWGAGPSGLARWFALFLVGGFASAATFLALNPHGAIPMVGASGAICALWGATARMEPKTGAPVALRSGHVWRSIRGFAVTNAVLFAVFFILSTGRGGLAWEGHLGGFVFGLLTAPLFGSGAGSSTDAAKP